MTPDLQLGDTQLIIRTCKEHGAFRNQAAYILATAYWETARTMRPVREYGGEKYLRSKRYYPHVGMGYVQLTWDYNYIFAGEKLGVDFLGDPRKLLDPKWAVLVLVRGMLEGWFVRTGAGRPVHPLTRHVTLTKSDYPSARKGVNGNDKKHEITAIARHYEAALLSIGYGIDIDPVETPKVPVETIVVPEAQPSPEVPKAPPAAPTSLLTRILSGVLAAVLAAIRK